MFRNSQSCSFGIVVFFTVNLFNHTNTSTHTHTLLSSCLWRNRACIYRPKLGFVNWSDEFELNPSVLLRYQMELEIEVCSLLYFMKLSAGNGICKLSIKSNSIVYPNITYSISCQKVRTPSFLSPNILEIRLRKNKHFVKQTAHEFPIGNSNWCYLQGYKLRELTVVLVHSFQTPETKVKHSVKCIKIYTRNFNQQNHSTVSKISREFRI
jgi:hypothetical protein